MTTIDEMRTRLAANANTNSEAAAASTGSGPSDEANGAAAQPQPATGLPQAGVTVLSAPAQSAASGNPIAAAADVTGVKPLDSGTQVIQQATTGLGAEAPVATSFLQQEVAKVKSFVGRVFQHVYAGANTILPDGTKLTFGGPLGSQGTFITNVPEEVAHLEKLAKMPGSQISEIVHTADGRDVPTSADAQFSADQAQVRADAAANSARDLDPNVVAARSNLAASIAQG